MSIAEPSKFGLRRMDVAVTRSHGSGYVLDMSETALLVIDMFNTYSCLLYTSDAADDVIDV